MRIDHIEAKDEIKYRGYRVSDLAFTIEELGAYVFGFPRDLGEDAFRAYVLTRNARENFFENPTDASFADVFRADLIFDRQLLILKQFANKGYEQ